MSSYRWLLAISALCLASVAMAQGDPDEGQDLPSVRTSKTEEWQKFHKTPVIGMSANDWLNGYKKHVQMEADSPFGGIHWRSVGPEIESGRVNVIVAPEGDPSKLYVAFATGGLWRTDDDGATWTSLFDNQSSFGIGAVAVDRSGKTIWVGTGEENSQRTSYAGTGVFKSTDSGKTWQYMGLPESQHIGKILIDPKNENVVYVAALGHLYSQNPERGVYKTTDGGKSWRLILKQDSLTGAVDMVMDPRNPNVVYASMWQKDRRAWDFVESGPGSAVYRTANGGVTWQKITALPSGDAAGRVGLAICEKHPDTVYALVDNQSDDKDWVDDDERLPSGRLTPRRFALLNEDTIQQVDKTKLEAFLKTYDNTMNVDSVLADIKAKKLTMEQLTEKLATRNPNAFRAQTGAELYRTDNGGKTWARTLRGKIGPFGGYYWGKCWVNPSDPDDVYVMGVPLLRSKDGGKTWASVFPRAHVDYHAVWNDLRDPRKVYVGNDGGLYQSFDGGSTIRHMNNLAVGQPTTIAVDDKTPYNIYTGLQDNGTMRGPSTYRPGFSDLSLWKDIGGGDGAAVAVDPRNGGDLVYTASQFGAHSALNLITNQGYSARPGGGRGFGDPDEDRDEDHDQDQTATEAQGGRGGGGGGAGGGQGRGGRGGGAGGGQGRGGRGGQARGPRGEALRFNWVSPLVISTHDPNIIYVGAQRLFRSFDQGHTYEPISPDLTKNLPNGNVPYSTIKDVSESPIRFGLIYVGCDDGNVKMTPDGGFQWVSISTPQPDKWVSRVVASKWDEKTVYVSQSGYREDDFSPYLWKSTDEGKTWKSIVGNLPNETINVIREDPNRDDVLYVGTDMGVYISFDGGTTWEILQGGLPNTPVHDMVIQAREKDLVIATHARSCWVLPLEKILSLTPALRKTDLKMDAVDNVTHEATWGFDRREAWDTRPPRAPNFTFSFWSKVAGRATLRVKDKAGKVVKEQGYDAVRGFNTFSMDLELTPAKIVPPGHPKIVNGNDALKDPNEANRATYIPVGSYKLELQVGSATVSQDWKIED